MHIPNPLRTSVLNPTDDLKITISGEPSHVFDSGKENRYRFITFKTTQNIDELEFSEKNDSEWNIFSMSFLIYPALYHAWSYQRHNSTVCVLSDEKLKLRNAQRKCTV